MAQSTVRQETTLHLTRTFAAPRDKVLQAWTDPEKLKQWWGPPGYATLVAEVDLRVGWTGALEKLVTFLAGPS